MLEPVEHQGVLPVKLFHHLQKSVQLAGMDLDGLAVLVIDRPAAQLQ